MKECPNCKSMMEDDALFCGECGTKFELEEVADQVEETTAPPEKKCIHCGETIEEDCAFCPYCGKLQEEVKEAEPQIEDSKPEEEPVVEEKHEPEEKAAVKEIPVQEEPEEQPMYIEEEEKSKTWLYVLLAVLIGGAGWYFFVYDSEKSTSNDNANPVEMTDNTSEEVTDNTPVEKGEKLKASTPLAFLEQFYKGDLNNVAFIHQNITPNVGAKLRADYYLHCPSGNCIATWVFTAYTPGDDLTLEKGPIITPTKTEGRYKVDFKYSYYNGSRKNYITRTVFLTVTGMDSDYYISDYEVVKEQSKDEQKDEQVTQEAQETQTRETPSENNDSKDMSAIAFKPQETKVHESPKVEDTNIYDKVDQMPSFPGGQRALMSRINSNLKYPVAAEENGIQGKVVCSFVVERDGSISDVRVVRGVDPSLDREAVRVLKQMPHWIPGKKNGSVVRVRINVPVIFSLQ